VIVEFGIHSDGQLAYALIRQSSGIPMYDEYSLNVLRNASPFPAPPVSLVAEQSLTTTILMKFNYDSRPFDEIIRERRAYGP